MSSNSETMMISKLILVKYCPDDVCTTIPKVDLVVTNDDNPNAYDYDAARQANANRCFIYQDRSLRDYSVMQCYNTCKAQLDAAKEAGRTSNYGCMGFYPLNEPIPWIKPVSNSRFPISVYVELLGICQLRIY